MVTGANTPWEIKLSFRPQPLLDSCSISTHCTKRVRKECERARGGAQWRGTTKERVRPLIYLLLMTVTWHEICEHLTCLRLPPIIKVFLWSVGDATQYTAHCFTWYIQNTITGANTHLKVVDGLEHLHKSYEEYCWRRGENIVAVSLSISFNLSPRKLEVFQQPKLDINWILWLLTLLVVFRKKKDFSF